MHILFIEDDKLTAATIAEKLRRHYSVDVVIAGLEGESKAHQIEYDLLIIDYNLPDIDGLTVCKRIRENGLKIPILMLTGRAETKDKVAALDAGADDYLTKPFSFEELLARIRALIRRHVDAPIAQRITVNDLTLDMSNYTVSRGGVEIPLRRKQLQLLEYLLLNRGRTVTRDMIVEHIWDSSGDPFTNTVDVHIKYLRDQIDKNFPKKLIKTVYGIGYRIE